MSVLDLETPAGPSPRPPDSARAAMLREMREGIAVPGSVWVLSGPSGIGKTYLARRLEAARPPAQIVWARGTSWGRPFQPFREAAAALGLWPSEAAALPGDLFGVSAEVRTRETLIGLFQRRGQAGPPLVLCCDGLESFDAASLEGVRALLRRRERLSLSLLLLLRKGALEPPGFARLREALGELDPPAVRRLEVPPLTVEEVAAFCRERLGGPVRLAEAHFQDLHQATAGNPRHLQEIVDFLRDVEVLVPSAGGWRRGPGMPATVPGFEELVRRRLEAALAREKPEARTWLERGAVFGLRLDVPPRLVPALERIAARTGYLEQTDEGPASFRFADERTREAIRAFSGEDWLPVEQIPGDDPLLATLYEREGEWRLAAEETTLLAVRALTEEVPSEAARQALWTDQLLARAGDVAESPGRLAAAEIRAQALLDLGRDREIVDQLGPRAGGAQRAGRPLLLYLLGAAGVRLGSPLAGGQGLLWLGQARQQAGDDRALDARIELELALARRGRMDARQAQRSFSNLRTLAEKARDLPLRIALARRSRLFLEPGLSRLALERGLELARESGRELEEALCFNNLAVVFYELGLVGAAECHALACLEILDAHGPWGTAVPLNNLALFAVARGEWERAEGLFALAGEAAGGAGTALLVRCNQAMVRTRLGAPGEAAGDLRRLAAQAGPGRLAAVRQAILFNLARTLLEAGQAAEALAAATVPPPCLPGDEDLAEAALAVLRFQALQQSGVQGRPEKGLVRHQRLLAESSKPQAWMYRSPWARGDLLFF